MLGNNYQNLNQLKNIIKEIKTITNDSVLLAVDQEPGRVQRFKTGFPQSHLPQHYVSDSNIESFRNWCKQTAELMAELGLNFNLGPVVDLCSFKEDYPVLTGRSFGNDIETVNLFSRIFISEFKKYKILTCAKHFPGLGSAVNDPHEKIAVSDQPIERFQSYHWEPFKAAINAGADFIMTTHLLAYSIDNVSIATYSTKTIDYLRSEIKFRGPAITDDIYMQGADAFNNIGDGAARAIKSGHSMVIISRDIELQKKAIIEVEKLYRQDSAFRVIADANEKIIKKISIQ